MYVVVVIKCHTVWRIAFVGLCIFIDEPFSSFHGRVLVGKFCPRNFKKSSVVLFESTLWSVHSKKYGVDVQFPGLTSAQEIDVLPCFDSVASSLCTIPRSFAS